MSETVIAQTNSGPVRGRRREGPTGQTFYSFQNIPYAKAPVGELRFKAPQPVEPWTDVRDATAPGPYCHQMASPYFAGDASEECLYVNVYTRTPPSTWITADHRPLPVMVMLHGGGFIMGGSGEEMNAPDFLLEHDIVYVSVNYRLGVFGFLSIADPSYDMPGNAGLKDQSLALRWVRQNCAHFGGDAGNVTAMGLSAGAASVHYHMISEQSRGLFDRAIIQSGSALNTWANCPPSGDLNERLARALGWSGNGGDAAMLRTIIEADATVLGQLAQTVVTDLDQQNGVLMVFVPTIEPYDNGTRFIDRDLRSMNRTAWGNRIPIMVGGTSGEGHMMEIQYKQKTQMFADNAWFDNALPRELGLAAGDSEERRRLGERLRRFYYGEEQPSLDNFQPYANLLTEKLIWNGVYAIVHARVALADIAPTYLYYFDYSSEQMLMMQMMQCGNHVEQMTHAEDMLYQFRFPGVNDALPENSVERQLRVDYNSLCTSFAASGKPTSSTTAHLNWEPVIGPAPYQCLHITKESSIGELPITKRLQFWESLSEN